MFTARAPQGGLHQQLRCVGVVQHQGVLVRVQPGYAEGQTLGGVPDGLCRVVDL